VVYATSGTSGVSSTFTYDGSTLNVTGIVNATQYKLNAFNTAPVSATDVGNVGEIRIDSNYIYICITSGTWKRVAISTWP
jgi:hypothetical protein